MGLHCLLLSRPIFDVSFVVVVVIRIEVASKQNGDLMVHPIDPFLFWAPMSRTILKSKYFLQIPFHILPLFAAETFHSFWFFSFLFCSFLPPARLRTRGILGQV